MANNHMLKMGRRKRAAWMDLKSANELVKRAKTFWIRAPFLFDFTALPAFKI